MAILLTAMNLKILWFNEFLGLALDKKIENQAYPLTSYYIWPKTDAWEQLKLELDSLSWLPKKEKIQILNNATEVINFWGKNKHLALDKDLLTKFSNVYFIDVNN